MTTDRTPCTRCGAPTTFVSGLCAPCAQRRAQHLDELRLFGPRPSRRMKSHPHPPNREDHTDAC